jgi:hypothetical protein
MMIQRVTQLSLILVASLVAIGSMPSARPNDDRQALRGFTDAVDKYIALRHHLERQWPALDVSDDPRQIHAAVEARRTAIVRARADARTGDFFNAAVSDLFRSRIARVFATRRDDVASLLSEMSEDGEPWRRAVVNSAFVWGTAAATPPSVLTVLPALPPSLQYRFVGPDLVLVDIEASVILDVVSDVLDLPSAEGAR